MQFASDNWAGVSPEVMAALDAANAGWVPAYGGDALTAAVTERFSEIFEREVEVWFVATGTAANSIGLASLSRPGGMVFCSDEAHVHGDEWGATEFQSGGMKLIPLPEVSGKISAATLKEALARYPVGNRFGMPVGLSVTNSTELGTVYTADEVSTLARMAHEAGLAVHLDGARFANAVAALNASPADLTWRAGVDLMSFGGTKNGCMAADAIVVFSPERASDLRARRQRAGHTFSKSRYMAAQFEGYLAGGMWLKRARHANEMADRLRGRLTDRGVRLGWDSQANAVFPVLGKPVIARLREAGAILHEWPTQSLPEGEELEPDQDVVRLVTSWETSVDDVDAFAALI